MKAPNPYVGPHPLSSETTIFGRDRELAEVVDLLLAERIVVLLSPSGAGKTSLIQARDGVRDRLTKEGFAVHPTVRVQALHSASAVPPGCNRYVAAVHGWLDSPAAAAEAPTLSQALVQAEKRVESDAHVFIFDQFEELLTLDPLDLDAKTAFMKQLGDALAPRHRWALVAMREEYLAAIEPYARWLPTRLSARYRLDLLGAHAAADAIVKPAAAVGVSFDPVAASALVDDLRRIQVLRLDGQRDYVPGPYIEPVQLQVVCRRLWTQLPDGIERIDATHTSGRVTETALREYYDAEVNEIVRTSGVDERALRDWIERELITAFGFRKQVSDDAPETDVIRPALEGLEAAHLLKRERREITWYELAHDRLIQPVRESNRRWLEKHQSEWERRAAAWEHAGAPPAALPNSEKELAALEQWAATTRSGAERVATFLTAARQQALQRAQQKTAKIRIGLAVAITGLGVLAFVATLLFSVNARLTRANRARVLLERSQALRLAPEAPLDLSLQLALHALDIAASAGMTDWISERLGRLLPGPDASLSPVSTADASQRVMELARILRVPAATMSVTGPIRRLVVCPRDDCVVSLADGPDARVWALPDGSSAATLRHQDVINAVAISRNGDLFATAGAGGARLWDRKGEPRAHLLPGTTVNGIAFTLNADRMVTVDDDGRVIVWDVARALPVQLASGKHDAAVFTAAFNESGDLLATAGDDGVRLWNVLPTGAVTPRGLLPHRTLVLSLAFNRTEAAGSPPADGKAAGRALPSAPKQAAIARPQLDRLVISDVGRNVAVWRIPAIGERVPARADFERRFDSRTIISGNPSRIIPYVAIASPGDASNVDFLRGRPGYVQPTGIVWSERGLITYAAGRAQLWDVLSQNTAQIPGQSGEVARFTHGSAVTAVAVARRLPYVVTGAEDGTVKVWPLDSQASLVADAVSANGGRTAAIRDRQIVWTDVSASGQWNRLTWPADATEPPNRVSFSTDAKTIAAANNGLLVIWSLQDGNASRVLLPPETETRSGYAMMIWQDLVPTFEATHAAVLVPKARLVELRDFTGNVRHALTAGAMSSPVREFEHARVSPDGTVVVVWGTATAASERRWAAGLWFPEAKAFRPLELDSAPLAMTFRAARRQPLLAICTGAAPNAGTEATSSKVVVMTVAGAEQMQTLRTELLPSMCRSLAFDESASRLAIGTNEGIVHIVDVQQPGVVRALRNRAPVSAMAFSPDGQLLAAKTDDGLLHVWEHATGKELSRFAADHASMSRGEVVFASDRTIIVDGLPVSWRAAELIEQACRHVPRPLTTKERDEYPEVGDAQPCSSLAAGQTPR